MSDPGPGAPGEEGGVYRAAATVAPAAGAYGRMAAPPSQGHDKHFAAYSELSVAIVALYII